MSAKESWADFKDRTAIHGFSEYGGMVHTAWRVFWVLLVIGVGVICLQQVYVLSKEFSEHNPTTTVKLSNNDPLPKVGILVEPFHILSLAEGDPKMRELIAMSGGWDSGPPCPIYFGMRMAAHDLPENETENYFPSTSDLAPVMKKYNEAIWTHNDLFGGVYMNKRSVLKGSITSSTIRISDRGPIYVLDLGNKTISQIDTLTIQLKNETLSFLYYLLVGSGVDLFNPLPTLQLVNGMSYEISIRMVRYDRSKRYCNGINVKKKINCESQCMLDKAAAQGGCVPFMGEHDLPAGSPLCSFGNYDECSWMYEQCELECNDCTTCSPCDEVEATAQIESTSNDESVQLNLKFPVGARVQTFVQREAIGTVAFISQIGGSLGLCFGISILSLFHLLYSLVMVAKGSVTGSRVEDTK